MNSETIGVIGATSLVGKALLPMLHCAELKAVAFSRTPSTDSAHNEAIIWRELPSKSTNGTTAPSAIISSWICLAPVWIIPEHFDFLLKHGAKRIVALSSTSVYTKEASSSPDERALAARLSTAEHSLRGWAEKNGIEWIILRPTLIYGYDQDQNIATIASLIARFGFFPIFGPAKGLRQPIHARDVAKACLAALQAESCANRSYNISGGETLSYNEMLTRVFQAMGKKPRLLRIPLFLFKAAVAIANCLVLKRRWTAAMATRMNDDLVFDHSAATQDFKFQPGQFRLTVEDISN